RSPMSLYDCARVSTLDQDLAIQRTMLKAKGQKVIRPRGPAPPGVAAAANCADFLRGGDTLVFTYIDRPAGLLEGLQNLCTSPKPRADPGPRPARPFSTCLARNQFAPRRGGSKASQMVSTKAQNRRSSAAAPR